MHSQFRILIARILKIHQFKSILFVRFLLDFLLIYKGMLQVNNKSMSLKIYFNLIGREWKNIKTLSTYINKQQIQSAMNLVIKKVGGVVDPRSKWKKNVMILQRQQKEAEEEGEEIDLNDQSLKNKYYINHFQNIWQQDVF